MKRTFYIGLFALLAIETLSASRSISLLPEVTPCGIAGQVFPVATSIQSHRLQMVIFGWRPTKGSSGMTD